MSITSTDLVAYAATNNPVSDSGSVGGAIDLLRYVDFTQLSVINDDIEVVSSSASDTQNCTIVGRDDTGTLVSQTAALTGTTPKIFSTLGSVDRVLSVDLASNAIGNITVRRSPNGDLLRTHPGQTYSFPAGKRGFLSIFQQGASIPSAPYTYYAKFFWKNENPDTDLIFAQVVEGDDPSSRIDHGCEGSLDDTNTITNRITAPFGIFFDSTPADVGNAQVLTHGKAQGVWLKYSLDAGLPPVRSTYVSQIIGNSGSFS